MQILDCNVGTWKAQARISKVGKGQLLAWISAVDQGGTNARLTHTMVFDQQEGDDGREHTAAVLRRLLKSRCIP